MRFPRRNRGYGRRRYNGGRRGGIDPFLLTLVLQLVQQIQQLERKPPVTLGLMVGMSALFFYRGHPFAPSSLDYAL